MSRILKAHQPYQAARFTDSAGQGTNIMREEIFNHEITCPHCNGRGKVEAATISSRLRKEPDIPQHDSQESTLVNGNIELRTGESTQRPEGLAQNDFEAPRRRSLRVKTRDVVYDSKYHPDYDQVCRPNYSTTLKYHRNAKLTKIDQFDQRKQEQTSKRKEKRSSSAMINNDANQDSRSFQPKRRAKVRLRRGKVSSLMAKSPSRSPSRARRTRNHVDLQDNSGELVVVDDGLQRAFDDEVVNWQLTLDSSKESDVKASEKNVPITKYANKYRIANSTSSYSSDGAASQLTQTQFWDNEASSPVRSAGLKNSHLATTGFLDGAGSPPNAMELFAESISPRWTAKNYLAQGNKGSPGTWSTQSADIQAGRTLPEGSLSIADKDLSTVAYQVKPAQRRLSSTPPHNTSPSWFVSPRKTIRQKEWARRHHKENFEIYDDQPTGNMEPHPFPFPEDGFAKENSRRGRTLRNQNRPARVLQGDDELRSGPRQRAELRDTMEDEDNVGDMGIVLDEG